jgi:tetratricopeptide (TPR) repeat protein
MIAMFLLTCAACTREPALWEAYFAAAEAESDAGRLDSAEELLLRAAEAGPDDAWIRIAGGFRTLGHRLSFKKAYEDATRNYERALRMMERARPDSRDIGSVNLELGMAYEGMGDLERAETLMRKALDLEERYEAASSRSFFRPSRERRERTKEAIRVAVGNLAEVLDKRGKFEEAERFYLRDLAIMQEGIKGHHLYKVWIAYPLADLGELYRKQRRYPEAEQRFNQALQVMREQKLRNRAVTEAMNNYASMLKELGRHDDARAIYDLVEVRDAPSSKRAE